MQRSGVVFVSDPVISLDLAEILTEQLEAIQLKFPTSGPQAAEMAQNAYFFVSDRSGVRALSEHEAAATVPCLYLGTEVDKPPLSGLVALIELPFTNNSVREALTHLGLIGS